MHGAETVHARPDVLVHTRPVVLSTANKPPSLPAASSEYATVPLAEPLCTVVGHVSESVQVSDDVGNIYKNYLVLKL